MPVAENAFFSRLTRAVSRKVIPTEL
jgi:hypothetical protein